MIRLDRLASLFHPAFFRLNPELAHKTLMSFMKAYAKTSWGGLEIPGKDIHLFGVSFPNRIGLSAGFDKNAESLYAWQKLGFGFVEVGGVTSKAQPGNPQPRIFRFPEQKMILNRVGFPNDGAKVIARRIEKQRKNPKLRIPIGANIGKYKSVPIEEAPQEYLKSFKVLSDLVDYVTLNISSPNTANLRTLQSSESLKKLLDLLCSENEKKHSKVPLLLKLSPELSQEQQEDIAQIVLDYNIRALVLTNTSTDSSLASIPSSYGKGGISGRPLFEKSLKLLENFRAMLPKKIVLIGGGGIMDVEDALEKSKAGADLITLYTGFIYGGPTLVQSLVRALA